MPVTANSKVTCLTVKWTGGGGGKPKRTSGEVWEDTVRVSW